jgi:hypothetical protein
MQLGRCGLHQLARWLTSCISWHVGSHEVVSLSDTFILYLQIRSDYDFAIGIIVLCNHLPKVYAGHDHPIFWTEFE